MSQWFTDKPPKARRPQPQIPDPEVLKRVKEKINKVRDRGYIAPGFVSEERDRYLYGVRWYIKWI